MANITAQDLTAVAAHARGREYAKLLLAGDMEAAHQIRMRHHEITAQAERGHGYNLIHAFCDGSQAAGY